MKPRYRVLVLLIALAATLAAFGFYAQSAEAIDQTNERPSPMVGLARGQTPSFNVVIYGEGSNALFPMATPTNTRTATPPVGCTKPAKPVLLAPPDNKVVKNDKVKLEWVGPDGVDRGSRFEGTIWQDAPRGTPVEEWEQEWFSVPGAKRAGPLQKGHQYYWRISACNRCGCSDGSGGRFWVHP